MAHGDRAVIVECSTHPRFVSNTYLVCDREGGPAFFVDAGGPVQPLIEAAERLQAEPTHVLLTHHHFDHVCEAGQLRARWPQLQVMASAIERDLLAGAGGEGEDGSLQAAPPAPIEAGERLAFGNLEVRPLHTPGHTAGMLSFLVGRKTGTGEGADGRTRSGPNPAPGGFEGGAAVVFTGDTLFKDSVGGVKAPGHTSYTDLRDSIMGTLMELPPETVIYPGHAGPSTVAQEWECNPFVRIWRGLDPEGSEPCTAMGRPATLVLLGSDYDGGTKAWIRWPDGADDIVPGSQVQRTS